MTASTGHSSRPLRAGILSMTYEDGFLRHIAAGNEEVVSMIYFAVRDCSWNTLPSHITDEEIHQEEDRFTILYQRHFDHAGIRMLWQVRIEGSADSSIHYDIKGQALSSFIKNRAGLCILHPICHAGKEVRVTHTDGSTELGTFPVFISPHQPFKNITAIQWPATSQYQGMLRLEGDIFEMEDQRNWTDNSYKTYCTPLDLPLPAKVDKGQEIHQQAHLSVTPAPRPSIGTSRSAHRDIHYLKGLEKLSRIGFTHYRADIRLDNEGWRQEFRDAMEEGKTLNAPLEIALFPGHRSPKPFLDAIKDASWIKSIILPLSSLDHTGLLKNALPHIPIGGGTDSHFTDLNRAAIDTKDLDFVSYAIHPQVHAFDDATLMENADAQSYTVVSAMHKFNKPVHITPITLHDRTIADPRLHTEFGAKWTKRSLISLIRSGAASITYFEAQGDKGLMESSPGFRPFPVLRVLEEFFY